MFKACIIRESLKDQSVFDWHELVITQTKIVPYKEELRTPWVSQWTMTWLDIPKDIMPKVITFLALNIERPSWYANLESNNLAVFIFQHRVFYIPTSLEKSKRQAAYQEVIAYGISLGIPDYQMDILPKDL